VTDPVHADKAHCWHPFTPQDAWCDPAYEPLMIVRAEGVWLWDSQGRKYLDGNSSIWTNIHGHCRPEIAEAIAKQAATLDHSSYLGLGHPLASELAEKLVSYFPPNTLERVFFSDNGSTAVEAALKMSLQSRMQTGQGKRTRFLAFDNAYHGDTLGAASLGGVNRFFSRFRNLGFETQFIASMESLPGVDPTTVTAVVIEPLIQGVNEMRPWPAGMLAQLRGWTEKHGIHLILDEVMTGFGRTGSMFACQRENVTPDFLCLAKGLTGGTVPLAATLTTHAVYETFLGGAEKAFYYGHSYTANPIGCAAALASLKIFETDKVLEGLPAKIAHLSESLEKLRATTNDIVAIRQCGLIAGIEFRKGLGGTVTLAARDHGLLTRNILDTVVFMPPLSVTPEEIDFGISALGVRRHVAALDGATCRPMESSDMSEHSKFKKSLDISARSTAWHHAPPHKLIERGIYMVTAGTLHKQHHFRAPNRLSLLHDHLLNYAAEFGWELQAWAVFPNHYHFVAASPENPETLRKFLGKLHMKTAQAVNQLDGTPGRKVWHQFWDSRITFENSYWPRLRYVQENAVRHGLVRVASQYPWCSASWFERTADSAVRNRMATYKTDELEIPDDF
jgi:adenosylmethionine-8-amino-7-oxononanoate aminotransferase